MASIDLNTADKQIIEVLEEGRNTPANIARRLDYTREYVAQRLKRLLEHDVVDRPDRGLYELVEDIDEDPAPEPESPPEPDTVPEVNLDDETPFDTILQDWNPGRSKDEREQRLKSARKALQFLADRGDAEKSDFLDALYPDHAPPSQNKDTFWRTTIRGDLEEGTGALGCAVQAGVVSLERGPPHIYYWDGMVGVDPTESHFS